MALIGLGVGPEAVGPADRDEAHRRAGARSAAAMGTLMLLRQVGAAVALAAAETIYARAARRVRAASATGTGVFVIALVGAAVAAVALLTLPRPATRFAVMPAPA